MFHLGYGTNNPERYGISTVGTMVKGDTKEEGRGPGRRRGIPGVGRETDHLDIDKLSCVDHSSATMREEI